MAILNKNNFLRWEEVTGFTPAPFVVTANDDNYTMVVNGGSSIVLPLANDVASLGIDPDTFEIILQDNPTNPATWNAATNQLTYFPPAGAAVGYVGHLKYRFKDDAGNQSNEGNIYFELTARPTSWRGYAPSYACLGSGSPGMAQYGQLEKYYTDDLTTVAPLTLKANVNTEPEYIAPATDLAACPIATGSTGTFAIGNYVSGTIIQKIVFIAGGVPTEFVLNLDYATGLASITVEAMLWQFVDIYIDNNPAPHSALMEPSVGGSAPETQDDTDATVEVGGFKHRFANVDLPIGTYLGKFELSI